MRWSVNQSIARHGAVKAAAPYPVVEVPLVLLGEDRRWEHDVREPRGLVVERLLGHDEVELVHALFELLHVRLGQHGPLRGGHCLFCINVQLA